MKKRRVLALIAMLCMLVAAVCGAAACDDDEHTHSYGDWTITVQPTLETGGKATHKCTEDDFSEEVDIPALSDALWTKSVKTPATHAAEGVDTYTSSYGSVDVPSAKLAEHTYGPWTLTKKPTLTEVGTAERACTVHSDVKDVKNDVPALSDASVWTKDEENSTPASHTAEGKDVYTSEYGEVEVTLEKTGEHVWSSWSWKDGKEPTLTEGATAVRSCTLSGCTETEEKTVSNLTDTDVWTKDTENSHPATHTAPGTDVYKSEYGTVEVEIPAKSDEHQWSAWSWKDGTEPTEETGATATRSCEIAECNETEEKTVPNLKDASVWECDETSATYNGKGSKVYTSEYGTVTVETAKLVAPYDGKTYHQIDIDVDDRFNGTLSVGNNWREAELELDANGTGLGKAYPFSNNTKIVFTMVDPETGKISISFASKADGDAEDAFTGEVKTVTGYVDMETGFVLMAYNGEDFTECYLLTPYGQYSSGAIASVWGDSALNYGIALSYTYTDTTEKTETLYITNSGVHFGVTFTDLAGEAVAANACYNADQLYIKKGTETLASLGYNGTTMQILDGYEGEYTDAALGTVTLSGVGKLTVSKGDIQSTGTYTITGEENKLDLIVTTGEETKAYTAVVVREGDKTMTSTEAKVTVTFTTEHGTAAQQEGYKNVEMQLPEPVDDAGAYLFRGWFLEEGCTTPVSDPFKTAESVTLYAKWVAKITIKVHPAPSAETVEELEVGEGDNILESLQEFDTSVKDGKVFKDWYTMSGEDKVYLSSYPDSVYSAENDSMDLYSEWEGAPYIGEYYGANLDGTSSKTASTDKTRYYISISEDGSVSAYLSTSSVKGTVTDYSNGIITIKSGSDTLYFFFDELTGLLVTSGYNSAKGSYIGYDIGGYSRTQKTFNQFPIQVPDPVKGGDSQEEYARFVEMDVTVENDGADPTQKKILVLLYGARIYNNITITNALGEALPTIDAIKASKTIVVIDNSSTTQVFAKGSTASNLSSGKTADLDSYYGSYTGDGDELKLDGAGTLLWGEKKGTYKAAPESSSYTFDAYITEGETEVYYELTVDSVEKNYTLEKIDVNVTLDKGEVGEDETKHYNKNIKFMLDPLTDENGAYLFRGWFSDADFAHELTKEGEKYVFTPTGDATLYAKWIKKVTIHVHLDDATLPEGSFGVSGTIDTFGQGEEVKIARPTKSGSKFGGWFTDASFEHAWGEMATDGSTTVTLAVGEVVSIDLYPKWDEAPAYSGEYRLYYLDGSKSDGGVDTADTYNNNIAIDAEGYAPSVSGTVYPFSGNNMQVQSYDAATGAMVFLRVGYSTTFNAFFDSVKKIIAFVNYSDEIVLMIPADAGDVTVKSSYWGNGGGTRAINVTIGDESYNIFVIDDTVHFGVTFEDKNDEAIAAEEAYHTENRFYVKKGGEAIEGVKGYGYNGTTMVELDGYEGTYTRGSGDIDFGTIEVSGTGSLTTGDAKKGTYELVSGKDYTAELRLEGLFYYLTLTLNPENNTYTIVKPMATITYVLVDGTDVADYEGKGDILTSTNNFPASEQYNFKTEFVLTKIPEVTGYVFRGWYTKSGEWYSSQALDKDGDGNYIYTPEEMEVTLYARFVKKVTVEVHYQKDGVADKTLEVGLGEYIEPEDPGYVDGEVFKAWHLGSSDGEVWNAGTVAKEDIELYCEWQPGVPMFGSWTGANIYGQTDGGSTISGGWSSKSISVKADGTFSGEKNGTMTNWDPEMGTFKVGNYYAAIDLKNGVMIVDSYTDRVVDSDYLVFIKKTVSGSFLTSSSDGCYWNGSIAGSTKLAAMKLADGSKMNIFIYEGRVWGKVTFEGTPIDGFSGELTAGNVWQKAQTLVVKDSDGKAIASFVRGANGLEYSDGLGGTYSGSKGDQSQDLVLDGKGSVTWAGRTGTYHLKEESEDVIEVYLDADGAQPAEYWEITITTGDSKSYEAEQPMVTLTLNLYDETGAQLLTTVTKPVNKNIPITLSETYETYVSAGWYTDQGLQSEVELDENGLYVPTVETTLYAKMVAKVTLTIVYGNLPDEQSSNLPNVTVDLPKGTTPDLTKYVPEPQGSYVFGGWYEDEACTATPYEGTPITADKTIYCKWIVQQFDIESVNLEYNKGNWTEVGANSGVWKIEGQGSQNKAALKITFKASGTFTFDWACSISDFSTDYFAYQVNPSDGKMVWYYGTKVTTANGSGTASVKVEEGQTLYIGYYNFSSASSSDYAQVSNFKLA